MNTDKERIRAEVERLHEEYRGEKGYADVRRALRTVLFFIDSMQEEHVSKDLEKVFDKYSEELESDYSNDMFDRGDIFRACKFGAQWQKEQIMKNAISTIMQRDDCNDLVPTIGDMSARGFEVGDKVKVIIINEE